MLEKPRLVYSCVEQELGKLVGDSNKLEQQMVDQMVGLTVQGTGVSR